MSGSRLKFLLRKLEILGLPICLLIIILFTMNWMYLSENKSKWGGLNPVVAFAVNPKLIGFKSVQNQVSFVSDIIAASGSWFKNGGSKLIYKFNGVVNQTPVGFDSLSCDGAQRLDIPQGDVLFYANQEDNPDCTGSSCAYIWSCNDSIVHADVELNNSQYSWSYLASDGDIKNTITEALKSFGYLAGLGHCKTGERISDCIQRDGIDPDASSVMYKFPQIGKKDSISADDALAVQTIYGKLNLPFPVNGKYALTYNDLDAIHEIVELENQAGLKTDAGRQSFGRFFQSLSKYNYLKTNKTLREQYDEFIILARNQTPDFSKAELEVQRRLLTQGIMQATMLKEEVQKGYVALDIGFLDYTIQKHLELRNYTIDALEGK